MNYIDAIILAIIEGITEFLPISSTGHLVLTSHILGLEQTVFLKSFEIIIQLGAILAIVVLYFDKFFNLKSGIAINKKVWLNVLAAFIPTAIIGFTFYKLIKEFLLGNELITVLALFLGGIALITLEKVYVRRNDKKQKNIQTLSVAETIEQLTIKQSIGIGLAQSISIIPGVSRSAASILGGMFLGANRQTAVEFSFLLAIPTMMAATGLDLLKTDFSFNTNEWFLLSVGFIGSFIVALVVVKWFIVYVQKNTFIAFGLYRMIIAIIYWIFMLN